MYVNEWKVQDSGVTFAIAVARIGYSFLYFVNGKEHTNALSTLHAKYVAELF